MIKVIVFGSRTWDKPEVVARRISELPLGAVIVHGASPGGGADYFADLYGRLLGFEVIPVPINADDRRKAGKTRRAPILRTLRMLDEHPDAGMAIGFMDGETPGSAFTRDECGRRGIPTEVVAA